MEEESRNKEEEMREGEEEEHGSREKSKSKMSRITVGSRPAEEGKVGSEQQKSNLMAI